MHSAGHVKIAITTNSLTEVDAGFANAGQSRRLRRVGGDV